MIPPMFGSTDILPRLKSRETAAIPRQHEPLYMSRMKDGEIDNAKVVFLMSICQCAVLSWRDRLRPIHSRRAVREALLSHRWRHRMFHHEQASKFTLCEVPMIP